MRALSAAEHPDLAKISRTNSLSAAASIVTIARTFLSPRASQGSFHHKRGAPPSHGRELSRVPSREPSREPSHEPSHGPERPALPTPVAARSSAVNGAGALATGRPCGKAGGKTATP